MREYTFTEIRIRITRDATMMGVNLIATGEQLRRLRRDHNLTQEQLSELFSCGYDSASKNAISIWERGIRLPSIDHLVFLAVLYNCTLDELVVFNHQSRTREDEGDQLVPILNQRICCLQPIIIVAQKSCVYR